MFSCFFFFFIIVRPKVNAKNSSFFYRSGSARTSCSSDGMSTLSSQSLPLSVPSFSFTFFFSSDVLSEVEGEGEGEGEYFCFVGVEVNDCLLSTVNVLVVEVGVGVGVDALFRFCCIAFVMDLDTVVLVSGC